MTSLKEFYKELKEPIWLGTVSALGIALVFFSQTELGQYLIKTFTLPSVKEQAQVTPTPFKFQLIGTEPVAGYEDPYANLGGTPTSFSLNSPLDIDLSACPKLTTNWLGRQLLAPTYIVDPEGNAIRLYCTGSTGKPKDSRSLSIHQNMEHLAETLEYSRFPVIIDEKCDATITISGINIRSGNIFTLEKNDNITEVFPEEKDSHTYHIDPRDFAITSLYTHILNLPGAEGTTITITDNNDCGLVDDNSF